ncbi:flagellar motor protein MotD [Silanimonas lenta]|uniref:flagellar motor protein MotD n=1 Tax=Silanimonas lenta TaxID=265429 RepID=UPI000421E530|nr:flagellar motor protein MotD [Silanimonas lenta]
MARHGRHEEHVNHEAWAIPYGDLITLLLAFFVVMYAISTLNEGKYRVASESISAAFDGQARRIAPIQVGDPVRASQLAPAPPGQGVQEEMINLAERLRADALISPIELKRLQEESEQAGAQLDAIQRQVERVLGPMILSDQVTVTREGLWVEVNIRSDVLFASGSAALSAGAREAIEQLSGVLRELPNEVRVEGHTDDQPIASALYPSNWELSTARAASVVRLLESRGVDPRRLAAIGYGEKRPAASNATPDGRAANRRVVLVILASTGREAVRASQVSAASAVQSGAAAETVPATEAARPPAPVSVPRVLPEDD